MRPNPSFTLSLANIGRKLALLGILATLSTLLYGVDFISDFGTDYSVYFSNGWFMSKGLLPYMDFWTHKAPLLVMILAGWISLFGHSMVSAALFLIMVTVIASYVVYALSNALELGLPVAILSSLGFVFFTATHLLDPTRNGIIVILSSIFEMLAVIILLKGLKHGTRQHLLLSGFFVFLAFATRQTAAITYLGLMAIIFVANRKKSIRQAFEQAMTVSFGSVIAAVGFIAYFVLNKIPLDLIWDQIYTFNINYAAGYQVEFTDWVFGWMDLFQKSKLHLIGVGVLAYFIGTGSRLVKRIEIRMADWTLIILVVLHSLAICLQNKVQIIYFLQLLPEITILTGIALVDALGGKQIKNIKDFFKGTSSVAFTVASVLFLLLLPLKDEAIYSYGIIKAAKENGYLQNPENRPEYLVARQIDIVSGRPLAQVCELRWIVGYHKLRRARHVGDLVQEHAVARSHDEPLAGFDSAVDQVARGEGPLPPTAPYTSAFASARTLLAPHGRPRSESPSPSSATPALAPPRTTYHAPEAPPA